MTGVERLQHVERLAAAHLAHDEAVGTHPQRGADELAHGDRADAFGVRRTGLEPDDVRLREAQLRGLLDRDDPLGVRDRACESVFSNVVLPALVAPATRMFHPARTDRCTNRAAAPSSPKSSSATIRAPNRRIVTHGPSTARGGITAWRREPSGSRASTIGDDAIEPQAERRDDALDEVHDRRRRRGRARSARAARGARRTRARAR